MDRNIGFLDREKMPVVINPPGDIVSIPTRHDDLKDIRARLKTRIPMHIMTTPVNRTKELLIIGLTSTVGRNWRSRCRE
jgi:hypothetical protein